MSNPHTIVTVQGGKGKRVDVTRWVNGRHTVEHTEVLPQPGGGNLAQFRLDDAQAIQVYVENPDAVGEWFWLSPDEAETLKALRDGTAVVLPK